MKLKSFQSFFTALGLTITTLVTLTASMFPTFSQSNSTSSPTQVTFFCRQIFDFASGKNIPATVAWIPERQGNVRFIGWKSEHFTKSGWTPQQRCQEVTKKFQHLYSQGRLNYLSLGMSNGSPIICGLANQDETCNANNQLFTIKPVSNPEIVLQRLMAIAEGKSSDVLLQSSGERIYVPVENFLNQAPLISKDN